MPEPRKNKPEVLKKAFDKFHQKNKSDRVTINFFDADIKAKKEALKPEGVTEKDFYKLCLEAYEVIYKKA
jgi:hypothetical protein